MSGQSKTALLRSLLYVPASSERFIAKAHERGADAIILDLEDAVIAAEKAAARARLAEAMPAVAQRGATVFVRINSQPELHAPGCRGRLLVPAPSVFWCRRRAMRRAAAACRLVGEGGAHHRPGDDGVHSHDRGCWRGARCARHRDRDPTASWTGRGRARISATALDAEPTPEVLYLAQADGPPCRKSGRRALVRPSAHGRGLW